MSKEDGRVGRVARKLCERTERGQDWDQIGSLNQLKWRYAAQGLIEAGFIAERLPQEPLPDGQVRLDPEGLAWQRIQGRWRASGVTLDDDDVRDWPVLVPESERLPFHEELHDESWELAEAILESLDEHDSRDYRMEVVHGSILLYAKRLRTGEA